MPIPQPLQNDPLLTLPQVAIYLQIGRSTAFLYARKGIIPTIRFGKCLRVRLSSLLDWLDSNESK